MALMMVSPRDYTLRTRTGHVIHFPAGKPTHVPDVCVQEAMAVNILPTSSTTTFGDGKAGMINSPGIVGPLREALLFSAIDQVVKQNDSNDFNAGGQPKIAALNEITGLRVASGELSKLWERYREIVGTNAELPTHPRMEQVLELQRLTTRKQLVEYASEIGVPKAEVERRPIKEAKELLLNATLNYNEAAAVIPSAPDTSTLVED